MENFQYFFEWKAGFDPILNNHLKICAKNDTYLSPQSQNNVIHCCAEEIRDIITRHFNNIGFVGENLEVNEAYLGFVELSRTDALTITKKSLIQESIYRFLHTRETFQKMPHLSFYANSSKLYTFLFYMALI